MIIYETAQGRPDSTVYKRMVECLGTGQAVPWPLPNMSECPAEKVDHFVSIWGAPKAEAYGGTCDLGPGIGCATVRVYLTDINQTIGGGFAVCYVFSGPRRGERVAFMWGKCVHEFEHRSGGNCYHIYTCKKCGARYDVDSSD
jgi:hypothetical protein